MDWDILKKEREYQKENELIESKTKALFEKVDDVMKMQENLLKCSNSKLDLEYTKPMPSKHFQDEKKFCPSSVSEISIEDASVPNVDILNDMGQKGVHHFYRVKIKSLTEENKKLQTELKNKIVETKQLEIDMNQNAEEKAKWFLQHNLGKTQITKMKHELTALNAKLQGKEVENDTMKKEIDTLKREIRTLASNLSSNELKLNKALEENEANKVLHKKLKQDEKDMKESHRKQIQELTSTIRKIEKNKNELLHGFKKQLQLIDNLKRQKTHLETFNISEMAEAEFMKILDWKGSPPQ